MKEIIKTFYTIRYADIIDEGGTGTLELFLGTGIIQPVTVNLTSTDQVFLDGQQASNSTSFSIDELGSSHTKTIAISFLDNLIIEHGKAININISFSSEDGPINGLSEDLTVSITDNDFQRSYSADQVKVPSDGNNKIIYDLDLSANSQWNTGSSNFSQSWSSNWHFKDGTAYEYNLGGGGDDLKVSSGLQTAISNQTLLFEGGSGGDRIDGANFADGGSGDDSLFVSDVESTNFYRFYRGNTQEYEGAGVFGLDKTNVLFGGSGSDKITGNIYKDLLIGGSGNDELSGGAGNDTLYGDGWSSLDWVNPGQGILTNNWGVALTRTQGGSDIIDAGEGDDYVDGGAGNDTIDAGEGNNEVRGGLGADTITAGAGVDTIWGGAADYDPGVDGADIIRAGGGADIVRGEGGNDTIYGEVGDDGLYGGHGDDTIYGGEGSDWIEGQSGNDTLYGGLDDDRLVGGIGADTLSGGSGADNLEGGDQDDNLEGGDGDDILDGGTGADTITGGLGADTITGGDDADIITGGAGNDIINAGIANDTIDGGDGDDVITAGLGADAITGGAGRDQFIFTYADFLDDKIDVIKDFTIGATGDILNLSDVHTKSLGAGFGNSWAGAEWAYQHGYIKFTVDGSDTLVSYDQDGLNDAYSAKSFIRLEGVNLTSLSADNAHPASSDKLYKIQAAATLSEDSSAVVDYRVVLGREPTADVSVTITGGEQIYVNGSSVAITLTFTQENWFAPQSVEVTAIDDLVIERDHTAPLQHIFTSSDARFNGLSEDLTVSITDNDFQRSYSADQVKVPSDGNNKIIYDLDLSANSQWNTGSSNFSQSWSSNWHFKDGTAYEYNLGGGGDDLKVSSGLQTAISNQTLLFEGGSGGDRIDGANFADGGSGDDSLFVSDVESTNFYRFYRGNTQEYEGAGVFGLDKTNVLFGGSGSDKITGNIYKDLLIGGSGNDELSGGAGNDTLYGDGWSSLDWVNPGQGILTNNWGVALTRTQGGSDIIDAGEGDDYVDGGAGNDTIDAGEGNNEVRGGLGADTITAGAGVDTIWGGAADYDPGVDGADIIRAGGGADIVRGEGGNDTIYGEVGDDGLYGGHGDDTIYGGEGSDWIEGQSGNDTLYGGLDDDRLVGGIGADTLSGGSGADNLEGGDQDDNLEGGDGDDILDGGTGADTITGGLGADTITGGDDADIITGGAGNDIINAGIANDTIDGGDGDDVITAGLGADAITGGAGRDQFIFTYADFLDDKIDVIKDFTIGATGDILNLSDVHTQSLAANGANAGQENYPYSLGFINFIKSGSDTLVAYDIDGPDLKSESKAFLLLKDVDALTITQENLSVEGINFGVSRNGIISSISESNTEISVDLRIWGGQPSDALDVEISLAGTIEATQNIIFQPSEWQNSKNIVFQKGSDFLPEYIDNMNAAISSNDVDYAAESLRFKVEASGPKSSFVLGQAQNQANQKYYAFETSTNDVVKTITEGIPNSVKSLAYSATTGQSPFEITRNGQNLELSNSSTLSPGKYEFELDYIDENLNVISEVIEIDVFKYNEAPSIISESAKIITSAMPFSDYAIQDDGDITSINITLGNGFGEITGVSSTTQYSQTISTSLDNTTKTITLTGSGTAAQFETVLQNIEISENSATGDIHKSAIIRVTDAANDPMFSKVTEKHIDFLQGFESNLSVKTWSGAPISNASLFTFSDTEMGKLLKIDDVEFTNTGVKFDIAIGQSSLGIFDFILNFGENFEISSNTWSEVIETGNYFKSENTDTINNKLYLAGVSNSSLQKSDKLLTVDLAYTGEGSIKDSFSKLKFEEVNLGADLYEPEILFVANKAFSNSAGVFENVPLIEADTDFFISADIFDSTHAITSYDAFLAHKIAVLIEGETEVSGIEIKPEQILAADVNGNGRVNSMDVLSILQEITRVENNFDPEWKFIDGNEDLSNISRNNVTTDFYLSDNILINEPIEFKGILIGDVNGSWTTEIL